MIKQAKKKEKDMTSKPEERRHYGGERDRLQERDEEMEAQKAAYLAPKLSDEEKYQTAAARAKEVREAPIKAAQEVAARQKVQIEKWERENLAKRKAYTEAALANQEARVELGFKLRDLRTAAGLTLLQMSLLVGEDEPYLSRIERGHAVGGRREQQILAGYESAALLRGKKATP